MYRQRYPDDPGEHVESSFTRTTYRDNPSFCERVRSSLIAIIVGFALLITASSLIFWNEGRAVQTAKSLQEALDLVIPLQTSDVAFDQNNGKLVYLSGPLKTESELLDDIYGVSVSATKLRRNAEMYQWVEERHTKEVDEGDRKRTDTSYSYYKAWRAQIIPSTEFASPTGHHNPREMPVASMTQSTPTVSIGNFRLSQGMVNRINNFRQLRLTELPRGEHDGNLYDGMVYHGSTPSNPQVGDVRVRFEYAGLSGTDRLGQADVVSVIGKQNGAQLSEYHAEAGDTLDLLHIGSLTPQQIIGHEQAQNSILCWGLRFAGWLLMFIGFGCVTRIFVTIVDWIPIVRDVMNLGVMTFNVIMAISLSLTMIALGWLWYRPWLGGFILCLAVLPFILSRRRAVAATNRQMYYQSTHQREW